MNSFQEVFSQLILKKERSIKSICAPLSDCLDIPLFCYARVSSNGGFINLSNCPKELEVYYTMELFLEDPLLVHPDLLRSGFLLMPITYNPEYMQTILKKSNIESLLLIIKSSEGLCEMFFFGLKAGQETSLFSCLDLLYSFTRYFKREAAPIIERAIREQINVKLIRGSAFLKIPEMQLARKNPQIERFLNLIYPLSERERQCLDLFKEGKTAQMTGALLGLSQRTVEHYFDNIKNKLGCASKTDLLLW
jgi:DNA-binding CsgD family transcriptional regulator